MKLGCSQDSQLRTRHRSHVINNNNLPIKEALIATISFDGETCLKTIYIYPKVLYSRNTNTSGTPLFRYERFIYF